MIHTKDHISTTRMRGAGKRTKPIIDKEVWSAVIDEQVPQTSLPPDQSEGTDPSQKTKIAHQNEWPILLIKDGAGRQKVIDAASGTVLLPLAASSGSGGMVVVASRVVGQIHDPSEKLLGNHMESGEDRSLLGHLRDLVDKLAHLAGISLTSCRHEDHVTLQVAGKVVMLAVGDLPCEVWHTETGMKNEANSVVQSPRLGEGLVATLVSKDPESSTDPASNNGVDEPQCTTQKRRCNVLWCDERLEDVQECSPLNNITGYVAQASGGGTLEAMTRDGVAQVIVGIVWKLELVAVGIDHLRVGQDFLVDFGEQRFGRG